MSASQACFPSRTALYIIVLFITSRNIWAFSFQLFCSSKSLHEDIISHWMLSAPSFHTLNAPLLDCCQILNAKTAYRGAKCQKCFNHERDERIVFKFDHPSVHTYERPKRAWDRGKLAELQARGARISYFSKTEIFLVQTFFAKHCLPYLS